MPVTVYAQKRYRLCAEALPFMRKGAYLYLIVFRPLAFMRKGVTVYAQKKISIYMIFL